MRVEDASYRLGGLEFGGGGKTDFGSLAVLSPWLVEDDGGGEGTWAAFAETTAGTVGRVRCSPLPPTAAEGGVGSQSSIEDENGVVLLARGLKRPLEVRQGERDMGGIFILCQGCEGGGDNEVAEGSICFLFLAGSHRGRCIVLCEGLLNPRGLWVGKDMQVWFFQQNKTMEWQLCTIPGHDIASAIDSNGPLSALHFHVAGPKINLKKMSDIHDWPLLEPVRLCFTADEVLLVAFRCHSCPLTSKTHASETCSSISSNYDRCREGMKTIATLEGVIAYSLPGNLRIGRCKRRTGLGTPRASGFTPSYNTSEMELLVHNLPPIRDMFLSPARNTDLFLACCGAIPRGSGEATYGISLIRLPPDPSTYQMLRPRNDVVRVASGNVQALAPVYASEHIIFAEARLGKGCLELRKGVGAKERIRRMSRVALISCVPSISMTTTRDVAKTLAWSTALAKSACKESDLKLNGDGNEHENENNPLFDLEHDGKKTNSGRKSRSRQNIKVVARCRPLLPSEALKGGRGVLSVNHRTNQIAVSPDSTPLGRERVFDFDKVYGEDVSQEALYVDTVQPMVRRILDGFNSSVLCYGQTSSGKTWTMEGDLRGEESSSSSSLPSAEKLGIVPRAIFTIFESLKSLCHRRAHFIFISHVEIYNERLFDLLHGFEKDSSGAAATAASRRHDSTNDGFANTKAKAVISMGELPEDTALGMRSLGHRSPRAYRKRRDDTRENPPLDRKRVLSAPPGSLKPSSTSALESQNLQIEHHPELGVIVKGATQIAIKSPEQVFEILSRSTANRKTAETLCNATSSRSHAIFTVRVISSEPSPSKQGTEIVRDGTLNLVDLSGSENIERSGAQVGSLRAREAARIGQSLLSLGRVINALVEGALHIPYRESKLTRLLCECLGGNSLTALILNVTPNHLVVDETVSTLAYAALARSVRNEPKQTLVLRETVPFDEKDGIGTVSAGPGIKEDGRLSRASSSEEPNLEENDQDSYVVKPWLSLIPVRPSQQGQKKKEKKVGRSGKQASAHSRILTFDGPAAEWSSKVVLERRQPEEPSAAEAMLTEQASRALKEIFDKYDGNGDGRLERHELTLLHADWITSAAGVVGNSHVRNAVARRLLESTTSGGSGGSTAAGRLWLDQFLRFCVKLAERDPASLRALVEGSGFSLSFLRHDDIEGVEEDRKQTKVAIGKKKFNASSQRAGKRSVLESPAVSPVVRSLHCSSSSGWILGPENLWTYTSD